MSALFNERMTAEIEGEFVVFLIGMRVNKPWKIGTWLPVARAMARMIAELMKKPELGLLHARSHFGFPNAMVIQYWRSFDHLHHYATSPEAEHLPAWRDFNRKIASNGDVGIWHETYLVAAGRYEAVYGNMPRYGLAMAGGHAPARGKKKSARGRLGQTDGADQPLQPNGEAQA